MKEKKSTFKVKRMTTDVLKNQQTKISKVEFSDSDEDDKKSDTKMQKEFNDVSSMPRGESIAFGASENPLGEITQSQIQDFENDEEEFMNTVKTGKADRQQTMMTKPNKKSTIVQPNVNNNTVIEGPSGNMLADDSLDAGSDVEFQKVPSQSNEITDL